MCYLYQYFGPQWDMFQDMQLAFGISSCKHRIDAVYLQKINNGPTKLLLLLLFKK